MVGMCCVKDINETVAQNTLERVFHSFFNAFDDKFAQIGG